MIEVGQLDVGGISIREIETQRESNQKLLDKKLRDSAGVKQRTSKREVERLEGVKRRAAR